jgi:protein O-mannosyl-transferase
LKRLIPIVPVAALVLLGLAVYYPAIDFDFVSYDDPSYVSRNIHSLRGFNAEDFAWAWSTRHMGNWHPIAWWSFQLDSQLFGRDAWGFHFSSLLYHLIGTCLLYASLRMLKLGTGFSFLVSAMYCVHPLHVESVAWISERKGILSSAFWFSGMLAYAWYVRKPNLARMSLVFLAMLVGLMTKQMLVTFPFAMLLLDLWPLDRLRWPGREKIAATREGRRDKSALPIANENAIPLKQAILEKLPLFVLAIVFCWIAIYTQDQQGALTSMEKTTFATRLLNVPSTYVFTLLHAFWPMNLYAIYLPPLQLGVIAAVATGILLLITYLAWKYRLVVPAALVGWLWFLGCLFPLSGIMPLGMQWTADRYTDIPLVGIYLLIVQLGLFVVARFKIPAICGYASAVAALLLLSAISIRQLATWRDSDVLMTRVLEIDPENHVAMANFAMQLIEQKRFKESLELSQQAVELAPGNLHVRNNLGLLLYKLGQNESAIEQFSFIIDQSPDFAPAYLNLGNCFRESDRGKAIQYYRQAIELNPDYAEAHNNLGAMLASSSPVDAMLHYERSLQIWPENADAHFNLANTYYRLGQIENAIAEYNQALAIDSKHEKAKHNLQLVIRTQQSASQSTKAER